MHHYLMKLPMISLRLYSPYRAAILALGFVIVTNVGTAFAAAPAIPIPNVTVLGLHPPDTVTAGGSTTATATTASPRPCFFMRASNGQFYAIPVASTRYSELKQLALTAYVMKSPVNIYVINSGTVSAPTASKVCADSNLAVGYPEVDSISLN
jgi:hypothetical protein